MRPRWNVISVLKLRAVSYVWPTDMGEDSQSLDFLV